MCVAKHPLNFRNCYAHDRTLRLSNALEINVERLLSWIFVRAIISAQWFIEDGGDPSEALQLTAYVYPLLNYRA